jgi:hypothetical protein
MSKYLEDLADEGNNTSNLTLLTLVKIRRVLEKAHYSPADGRDRNQFQSSNAPPAWIAGVIQVDLDRIKAEAVSLSQEPGQNLTTACISMTLAKINQLFFLIFTTPLLRSTNL